MTAEAPKFVPIDYLLKSKIDVIELHVDKGGPTVKQLHETYMKILSQKPLLVWGDISENDLEFILKNLPPKGLAIYNTPQKQDSGI